MIFQPEYTDIPEAEVDAFVRGCELGRVVTAGEGCPRLGLYPFLYAPPAIELHMNRTDELLADLRRNPRCLFEVDEPLAVIPSYWLHPESAVMATAYHQTVLFECEATVSEDAGELAVQQTRLLARYQPEGGFAPVSPESPHYRGAIQHIAALRLEIKHRRLKWKLAQNRPLTVRAEIVDRLRKRGRHNDQRAADAVLAAMKGDGVKLSN